MSEPIDRKEALRIARETLLRAEEERREDGEYPVDEEILLERENEQLRQQLAEARELIRKMHTAAIPDGQLIRGIVEDIEDLRNDLCHWVGFAGKETLALLKMQQQLAEAQAELAEWHKYISAVVKDRGERARKALGLG